MERHSRVSRLALNIRKLRGLSAEQRRQLFGYLPTL